jgi:pyruvate formate lyase activating enzyme
VQDESQAPDQVVGRLHSIETFGTVDGPGTRLVVFCQGCPFRCAYCHNPDTWDFGRCATATAAGEGPGTDVTVAHVIDVFERNRAFYRHGGITVTGGEPMAQPGFIGALFQAAHAAPAGRIHTCLDTAGGAYDPAHPERYEALLADCDLVLLDVKHSDPEGHRRLVGAGPERPLALGDELARRRIPVIIRHVVVPGITDSTEELEGVGRIIARWPNVVGLDLLPYHTMGVTKYEAEGLPYRLAGVEPQDPAAIPAMRKVVMDARADERKKLIRA